MKIKLSILLLLFSLKLFAQTPYDSTKALQPISIYGNDNKNGRFRGSLNIPIDTIKMAVKDSGAIAFKANSLWSWSGYKWISGGSGGSGINQNLQQVTNIDSSTTHKITASTYKATAPPIFANNTAAVSGGLQNGDFYKLPYNSTTDVYLLAIVSIINGLLAETGIGLLTETSTAILTN